MHRPQERQYQTTNITTHHLLASFYGWGGDCVVFMLDDMMVIVVQAMLKIEEEFKDFVVKRCKTQVVAGINYIFEVVADGSTYKVTIWKKLDQTHELTKVRKRTCTLHMLFLDYIHAQANFRFLHIPN